MPHERSVRRPRRRHVDEVAAFAAIDFIIAVARANDVVASSAINKLVLLQRVGIIEGTFDCVVAFATNKTVKARTACDVIVTLAAKNYVIPTTAGRR